MLEIKPQNAIDESIPESKSIISHAITERNSGIRESPLAPNHLTRSQGLLNTEETQFRTRAPRSAALSELQVAQRRRCAQSIREHDGPAAVQQHAVPDVLRARAPAPDARCRGPADEVVWRVAMRNALHVLLDDRPLRRGRWSRNGRSRRSASRRAHGPGDRGCALEERKNGEC